MMMNNMGSNIGGNFAMEKPVSSVKLSIEALSESRIQEISLDGTETFFRPLTMSENLCKMATKIDFLAEDEGREDEDEEEEDDGKKPFQNQRWPWEGIRNRLQQALTEVNVLTDVLTVTHSKGPPKKEGMPSEGGKYMMFDQARDIPQNIKLLVQLPAKKKGLNAAADILFSGEKRMKSAGDEIAPDMGYHLQLLKLRKYWRIRRVGTKVLGDLSYRTAGSDFWHTGNFEVIKTTDDDDDDDDELGASGGTQPPFARPQMLQTKQKPALKVVVGADLRGSASIKISVTRKLGVRKGSPAVSSKSFILDGLVNDNDPQWHKTLSFAQNVLFCRELFEKLAKQSVQLKTNTTLTPFLVVGNKITTNIFPETELSIELLADRNWDKSSGLNRSTGASNSEPSDNIFSLKLAMMKTLLKQYQKAFSIPAPHPATAVFGLTKAQRKAPTRPFSVSQMQSVTERESKSLLESLVEMAKHWELKRRMCEAIDMLGNSILDPYIQAQWSTVGSPTETSVRIVIMSAGYEACNRTLVDATIGTDDVKIVQKDGRIISLSSDLHSIRDYFLSLLCLHQLSTAHEVCVILGWTIQHFSHHAGVGPREALGSVSTLMTVSPAGNSSVSLKCWISKGDDLSTRDVQINYEVHTKTARPDLSSQGRQRSQRHWMNSEMSAVQDPKWSLLGGDWRQVDWKKLYGRHFVAKFESLLVFLRSDK